MLKYMNDATAVAVSNLEVELGTPPERVLPQIGYTKAPPSNLFGLEVPKELTDQDADTFERREKLARLKMYRDDASKLDYWLRNIGVEPLAIITGKAFDKLLTESRLFTFNPSVAGVVQINRGAILQHKVPDWVAGIVFGVVWVAALFVFVWGFSKWGWFIEKDGPAVMAAICWLGWSCVWGGAAAVGFDTFIAPRMFTRRAQRWVDSLSWEQLLTALSYEGKTRRFGSPDYDHNRSTLFTRQLILPTPPERVIDKVCRVAKENAKSRQGSEQTAHYEIQIAAEAGAVQFKDGIAGLFDYGEVKKHLAAEAALLRRDPIIFICGNAAVAIIDQYGDFPFEQDMIDRVLNSEHLL